MANKKESLLIITAKTLLELLNNENYDIRTLCNLKTP